MTEPLITADGRHRGLVATSTPDRHFAVLALDHIGSMAETMRPHDPDLITREQIAAAKSEIVRRLHEQASAVLLDPVIGYTDDGGERPALGDGTGLMLGVEDGDYSVRSRPRLLPGWGVERAARAGADAIKISFWFDPDGDVADVERFARDVAAECSRCDLPLFVEPLAAVRDPGERRRVIVEGARRFSRLGADVLKLEFPADPSAGAEEWAEACAEVGAASAVPWTLLSAGADFDRFGSMLEVACDAGASGFVAGRAVWREAVAGTHPGSAWEIAADRLGRLVRITKQRAHPWTETRRWSG